jgi:folate-binding protein YgfZ
VEPVDQPFLLLGPEAPEIWARLFGPSGPLEAGDTEGGSLPDPLLGRWMRVREIGPYDLVVFPAPGSGDPLRRALAASGEACMRVSDPAFHLLRIEAGTPWFGLEGDEERLVPEVVPDDRVSDRKGCYLGQETIARTRWRGGVRRRLARLLLEGDDPVAPGTLLRDAAGESLGRLLSSAPRPDGRRLAFVLRELPRGLGVEESTALPRPCGEVVTETGRSGRWWEPDPTGNPTLI